MGEHLAIRLQRAIDEVVAVIMEMREASKGDDTDMLLSEFIRHQRDGWGMSLADLGRAANLSKAHIHDLEQDRSFNPSAEAISALAAALRVPPIQLLNAALKSQRILKAPDHD